MAKGRKKPQRRAQTQGATQSQPGHAAPKGGQEQGLESELRSVENMVEGASEGELGTLGKLLSKAKAASAENDEDTKREAAANLESSLSNLVGELRSEIAKARESREKYQKQSHALQQREERAESLTDQLERANKQLRTDQSALSADQRELANRQSELAEKERELETRLIDAEAGFAQKNQEMLDKFRADKELELEAIEKKKERLRTELGTLDRSLASKKEEIEKEQSSLLADIEARRAELNDQEAQFEAIESRLNSDRRKLELREKMLERTRAEDKEEIRAEFVAELERAEITQKELRRQISAFNNAESEYQKKLAEFNRLKAELGGDDPGEYLERMDRLVKRNEELQCELDMKPSTDLEQENKRFKQENQDLVQARENQEAEIAKLKTQVRQTRVAVIDKEGLSKENLVLSKQNDLLGGRINELRDEVDDLLSKQESKTAFPALTHMDVSEQHSRTAVVEDVSSLKEFALELRQRIAWDPETEKELFYREQDIQLFLAGLSMSRLHILQGISGTGKTSLAKAFARAVGGGSTTVSVQAGWRDKDDLIGHYNSFEKKFYERPCLQGLYEAQTPYFEDRPYIILLDEMNLSRPEQYFAEFLSALELDQKDQKLTLMTSPHSGAPQRFIQDQFLQIPKNVWFIGTANHDETTFEFADKTYDRAHVMELPRHEDRFSIDKKLAPVSYSFTSLEAAFVAAEKKYSKEIAAMIEEINHSDFVETLAQRMGVGWGNRLERQANRFISTMLATGATKGVALDHLIATKVLRTGKATGRYDTERDDVEKLNTELKALWKSVGMKDAPEASEKLIDDELRRKAGH